MVDDLRGITRIITVSNAGEARLSEPGGELLIHDRLFDVPNENGEYRTLLCLMRASFVGPQINSGPFQVTTITSLANELFRLEPTKRAHQLEIWVQNNRTMSWIARHEAQLLYQPSEVVWWWYGSDIQDALAEVLKFAQEDGEHCYVYQGRGFFLLEGRRGRVDVGVLSNSGEARISEDRRALLIDGRAVSQWSPLVQAHRRISCLVRADLATTSDNLQPCNSWGVKREFTQRPSRLHAGECRQSSQGKTDT